MMSPRTEFHSIVMRRPGNAIELAAPHRLRVPAGMPIRLGERQRPGPDILVVDAPSEEAHLLSPREVVLVVEIVSDESAVRDRETKPLKYARAGIRHFWRVEEGDGVPVVHVYELDDTTGAYAATGIHRDKLVVPVPFPMDFPMDIPMDIDPTTLFTR